MALYWYDKGEKVKNAWTAPSSDHLVKKATNPYQAHQSSASPTPAKIISTAKELMKGSVRTLSPSSTIRDARALFQSNRFRHVPIVDPESLKLVGLISDRDILRETTPEGNSFTDWIIESNQNSRVISTFMTTRLLTAHTDEKLVDIARAMLLERIGCMLIVNDDERLAGIITRSDILRLLVTRAPTELWL